MKFKTNDKLFISSDAGNTFISIDHNIVGNIDYISSYNGVYFVLGKLISLISKDEIRLTRLQKLLDKIKNQNDITEIILAFPMTPNGLFTDQYVRTEIGKAFPHIQIKSLGRGFATGSDPEYVDTDTITYALQNRS